MSTQDKTAVGSNPAHDTPIMRQYQAAKARFPKHLLFFRVGDFYELFYDDAKTISRALGLTLTSRNKGVDPIPMAGVPAHSAEPYLARLLRQGFSVAICDQMELASQAQGLVKREITRVVTPGTVLEENLLEPRKPNRIAAILAAPDKAPGASEIFGLAVADLGSGGFFLQELRGAGALRSEFARLSPTELLVAEKSLDASGRTLQAIPNLPLDGIALSLLKSEAFAPGEAHSRLLQRFSDNGKDKLASAQLKKLLKSQPLASCAAGALCGYIDETSPGGKVRLLAPQAFDPELFMELGEAAIRSLELLETIRARTFEGSLLWSIDRCCTPAGSRCLREWLVRPLRDLAAIQRRQDAVALLVEGSYRRADLRTVLKKLGDLERIAARLSAARATPRDLVVLKDTLLLLPGLRELSARASENSGMLESAGPAAAMPAGSPLGKLCAPLDGLEPIAETIADRLRDDCPNALNQGGLIRDGHDPDLDRLHAIASGGKGWIVNFQASEIQRSGISSLKIGYNRVFGYYIEISHANRALVPDDYERRQTLTNAERYTTPELKSREAEVLGAEEKIHALEQRLFLQLREELAQHVPALNAAGQALAELDALCSLAEVAHKKGHVRPALNNGGKIQIDQMRHPVLEDTIPAGELVANDLNLCAGGLSQTDGAASEKNGAQIVILTGPNMAGKSTYIRASALCTILAQLGAFVPAERAEIGIADRVFTRVGAADDLAGGRSTFMVEMSEVAEILAGCTSRSLLILDEVGRGTSTYDGVSLAWALIEHLHEGAAKPRTLFATHYHELGALEEELPRVANASASVKEWQGEITFLHRIVPGASERSFGIHVARLAGLPDAVLARAKDILLALEEDGVRRIADEAGGADKKSAGRARKNSKHDGQLLLFDAPQELDPAIRELVQTLKSASPHEMTPVQALSLLDELVRKARKI